jgi:hypothetical protein
VRRTLHLRHVVCRIPRTARGQAATMPLDFLRGIA